MIIALQLWSGSYIWVRSGTIAAHARSPSPHSPSPACRVMAVSALPSAQTCRCCHLGGRIGKKSKHGRLVRPCRKPGVLPGCLPSCSRPGPMKAVRCEQSLPQFLSQPLPQPRLAGIPLAVPLLSARWQKRHVPGLERALTATSRERNSPPTNRTGPIPAERNQAG